MGSQSIEALIEGGKATAAPPLGPALGPLGVNIGQVVADINKKTEAFKGMQVPVTVTVEDDKSYDIKVGTPPASALIKKEAGVEKGSSNPKTDKIADLKIEQIIKVAKMKESDLSGKDLKSKVREVIGTCNSMGILVEGKPAIETLKDIAQGAFAEKIASGKTELSAEELAKLQEEKKKLAEELEKRRTEFTAKAKEIVAANSSATRNALKVKMTEAGIPSTIQEEVLPAEEAASKDKEGEAKK